MRQKSIFEMNQNKTLTYYGKRIYSLLTANKTDTIFDLFHEDMPTAVREHIEKNLNTNNPWKGHVMIKYDGHNLEWSTLYITNKSNNDGFIGYLMPTDEKSFLKTVFEYSVLKQFELTNRLHSHIVLKNLATDPIST